MGSIQSDVNDSRRQLSRQIRSLTMIKAQVEAEERGCVQQLKRTKAKHKAMRILALRRHASRLDAMVDKLQDVSLKLASLPAEDAIITAMETLREVSEQLNRDFDRIDVPRVLADTERVELKSQVIGDQLSVTETGDEEEAEVMISQLYDELGLQLPVLPVKNSNPVLQFE